MIDKRYIPRFVYEIKHEETLVGYYQIAASSESDAIKEFYRLAEDGKIDFSDLEMVDSEDKIIRCEAVTFIPDAEE